MEFRLNLFLTTNAKWPYGNILSIKNMPLTRAMQSFFRRVALQTETSLSTNVDIAMNKTIFIEKKYIFYVHTCISEKNKPKYMHTFHFFTFLKYMYGRKYIVAFCAQPCWGLQIYRSQLTSIQDVFGNFGDLSSRSLNSLYINHTMSRQIDCTPKGQKRPWEVFFSWWQWQCCSLDFPCR